MHRRGVHGFRTVWRYYADEDGVCPACRSCFVTRARLIKHLADKRRTKCGEKVLADRPAKLSEERVAVLDDLDRIAKREARRQGHSHAIAVGSARTADGKRVGRVSA